MKKITTLVALSGLVGLSTGVSAADIESSAGLGLELGAGYYGFDSDRNIDDGPFGTIGAEIRTNSGLAFSLWWMGTGDLNMDGLGDNNLPRGDAEVSNYRGDMTYYFSNGRWQPYLSLGINRLFVDYEIDGGSWTTQGNLGGGVKFHMSPGWFLRAEVRFSWWRSSQRCRRHIEHRLYDGPEGESGSSGGGCGSGCRCRGGGGR